MKNTWPHIFFLFGLLCFSFFRIGYTLQPLTVRDEPIELDDAYTYAWKAVNFDNCFFSDCPAQNDLWQQYFAPTTDESLAKARRRGATFTFHRYTFLHEAILSFVKSFGITWAETLNLVAVIGICCIVLALAFWLYQLWGPAAAGFSLLAVGPMMKWQDFQLIVPFVLTLAIAGVLWGIVLKYPRLSLIAVPVGSLLLILMHPVGRIYSVVAIGLLLVQREAKGYFWRLLVGGLSLLLVAAAFMLPRYVDRPLINEWDLPHVAAYQWWPHFVATLVHVFGRPGSAAFFLSLLEWITLGVGFVLAVVFSQGKKRSVICATGVMFAGVVFLSLFYVWPGYPGLLFGRIWTPIALFFFAAGGFAIGQISRLQRDGQHRVANWLKGYALLIIALVTYQWVDQIPKFFASIESRTFKHNFVLDVQQTALLQEAAAGDSRILYLDEVPMIFHLNYGAHRYGAVFLPVITRSEIEDDWIREINFVVGFNKPMQDLAHPQRYPEGLYLESNLTVTVETPEVFLLDEVQINVAEGNNTQGCDLEWSAESISGISKISSGKWLNLTQEQSRVATNRLIIKSSGDACNDVRILGVRLHEGQSSFWPWTTRAKVTMNYADEVEKVGYFDVSKLLQDRKLGQYLSSELSGLEVMSDSGSLILLKR